MAAFNLNFNSENSQQKYYDCRKYDNSNLFFSNETDRNSRKTRIDSASGSKLVRPTRLCYKWGWPLRRLNVAHVQPQIVKRQFFPFSKFQSEKTVKKKTRILYHQPFFVSLEAAPKSKNNYNYGA